MTNEAFSTSTSTNSMAGYYGKLPFRGDFIQRNLAPSLINTWDQWLQNVIGSSRNTLGEHWLNYYLVSPIWRFYLKTESGDTCCGVMLPSVDEVGRYFPFAIINHVDENLIQHTDAVQYILNNQQWFNAAENTALQALDEHIGLEQLNQSVDTLNTQSSDNQTTPIAPVKNFRIPLNSQGDLNNAFSQLKQILPSSSSQTFSYWWTAGNERIAGNLICCDNMPDDNMYIAMLDGQWDLCHIQTYTASSTNSNTLR